MIRPPPPRIMTGAKCLVMRKRPTRLLSTTRRRSVRSRSSTPESGGIHPAAGQGAARHPELQVGPGVTNQPGVEVHVVPAVGVPGLATLGALKLVVASRRDPA